MIIPAASRCLYDGHPPGTCLPVGGTCEISSIQTARDTPVLFRASSPSLLLLFCLPLLPPTVHFSPALAKDTRSSNIRRHPVGCWLLVVRCGTGYMATSKWSLLLCPPSSTLATLPPSNRPARAVSIVITRLIGKARRSRALLAPSHRNLLFERAQEPRSCCRRSRGGGLKKSLLDTGGLDNSKFSLSLTLDA